MLPPPEFIAALSNLTDVDAGRNADKALRVRPRSTDDVTAIVKLCATRAVAIVPVGGNTGLSGGTTSPAAIPAIELSTERLNKIRSIDPQRWTITAEAGVTIQAIQEAARAVGRKFAPDWGARGSATIGGAVATDAGGNNVIRYGNMRENVLGLEVVLADGTTWDGLRALRKDSSGYDLKQLFIGSEGTLGVVTAAVLRLVPATNDRCTALAALTDLEMLAPLVERVRTETAGTLTALELIPDEGLRTVAARFDIAHPLPATANHHVLIALAGVSGVTNEMTAVLDRLAKDDVIADAVIASSTEQEAALWHLRDLQSPTQSRPELVEASLKYDAAVPVDQIGALLRLVEEAVVSDAPGGLAHAFGHVGDGNIHIWVLPPSTGKLPQSEKLRRKIDDIVIGLGGTLSAEHGIGTLLRDRVTPQKPAIEWELMRTVKAAFDPQGLFNPEKMLPPQPPT